MSRYHLLYSQNTRSEKVINDSHVTIKYASLLKGQTLCRNYTSPNASPITKRYDLKRSGTKESKENKSLLKIGRSVESREGLYKPRPLQERSKSTLNSQRLQEIRSRNSELKQKLHEINEEEADVIFKETKSMRESLQEREGNRVALNAKYEKLKSDMQTLPNLHNDFEIKDIIKENLITKAKLEQLRYELKVIENSHISKQELNDIQEEVRKAERNQCDLIERNRNLKAQIEDEKSMSNDDTAIQIRSYSRECAFLLKELDILQRLATSIFTGEEMDLSFILGSNLFGDMEGKSLSEIVGCLRKEMNSIMSLVIS